MATWSGSQDFNRKPNLVFAIVTLVLGRAIAYADGSVKRVPNS